MLNPTGMTCDIMIRKNTSNIMVITISTTGHTDFSILMVLISITIQIKNLENYEQVLQHLVYLNAGVSY